VSDSEDLPTNWGRWGEHDERGTLNLITAGVLRRAQREHRVRSRMVTGIARSSASTSSLYSAPMSVST
jgi:hypothetical protein